jgi:cell wall-associated NlpC family hydrolase
MPVPIWAAHYIGLPFAERGRDRKGVDCWGLVRLVMAEQFGRSLPAFTNEYDHTCNQTKIAALVAREVPRWRKVVASEEQLGDVIVMRVRGVPMHVGLVLGDGQMLHTEKGINSTLERYTSSRWHQRLAGFYRYRSYLDEWEYPHDAE